MLQIVVFFVGLVILIRGNVSVTAKIRVIGPPARAIGLWTLLYLPLSFAFSFFLTGFWLRQTSAGKTEVFMDLYPQAYKEVSFFAPLLVALVGVILTTRASRQTIFATSSADNQIAKDGSVIGAWNDSDVVKGLATGSFIPSDLFLRHGMASWEPLVNWSPRVLPSKTPLKVALIASIFALVASLGGYIFLRTSIAPGTSIHLDPITKLLLEKISGVEPNTKEVKQSRSAPKSDVQVAMEFGDFMARELTQKSPMDPTDILIKAAESGYSAAQFNLGTCYFMGTAYMAGHALPKDPALAKNWWEKAARQGHTVSQMMLTDAGFTGNRIEAWAWACLAKEKSEGRQQQACEKQRQRLEEKMTPTEKAAAIQFLAKFKTQGVR